MEVLDFKKMCRLCLRKDCPLTKIFPENDSTESSVSSIAPKIMACVGIEVEPGENLPDQICNTCKDELERWEKFKKLCECSNEELITGMPPLPDEVLEKNLQKSNSDNLETSSDFGLGDVSLLEHDSLFDSIDGSRDENLVSNDLIANKPFTSFFKQDCDNANNWNKSEEQLKKEAEEAAARENNRSQWREKYSRIYKKEYKCEVCSKVFTKFNMLLQHDKIDHRDIAMTETCDKCDRLFISKQRLDIHYQIKHRDKVYECDICGLKSVSEKSLKVHKIRHSGRFVCDICGLATNTNRSLQDHKLVHLEGPERPQYICKICERQFKHQQTLQEHLKTHVTDKPEWKCGLCNKEFKNQQYLNKHKNSHTAEKLSVCEECGAVLKNKTTLYIHKLKHREKQHMCLICDKMFLTKNLLTRHMSVHRGETNVCSICNKLFSRNDTLMMHLKTHQNSQVFCCDQCGKSFSLQIYLKRHLARIHRKVDGDLSTCVAYTNVIKNR